MNSRESLPIILRAHPRAKRLKLSFDRVRQQAIVTHPRHISAAQAQRFAAQHYQWIERQLHNQNAQADLPYLRVDEQVLPFRGQSIAWLDAGLVPLDIAALMDWYAKQARIALHAEIECLIPLVVKKPTRISIRNNRSRWGSCSAKGALSFSWRLIVAPPMLLRYVGAHEMAHLDHMNHSAAFWAQCAYLYGSEKDMKAAHKQLRHDSVMLMRFLRDAV